MLRLSLSCSVWRSSKNVFYRLAASGWDLDLPSPLESRIYIPRRFPTVKNDVVLYPGLCQGRFTLTLSASDPWLPENVGRRRQRQPSVHFFCQALRGLGSTGPNSCKLRIAGTTREVALSSCSRPHLHHLEALTGKQMSLLRAANVMMTRSSPFGENFAKHWIAISLTIAFSTSRRLVTASKADTSLVTMSAVHCKAAFRRRRPLSNSLTKSHRFILCRLECWRTASRQFFGGEIEAANAAAGASPSQVSQHAVLATSYVHFTGQGTTGSSECACATPSAAQVNSRARRIKWGFILRCTVIPCPCS